MTATLLSPSTTTSPIEMIRPRRKITGISAILLPFTNEQGQVDWDGLRNHVARTAAHGIAPAVNMDTGYANMIDEATRRDVLRQTRDVLDGGPFVAGAFVADSPGDAFDFDAYRQQLDQILEFGGTPIIFQSYGLTQQSGGDYRRQLRANWRARWRIWGRVHRLRAGADVRPLWQNLRSRHLRRAA